MRLCTFVLAPSYVTYNAATIQHVQEFFRTEEVYCRAEKASYLPYMHQRHALAAHAY